MISSDISAKELFDYVRSFPLDDVPPFKEILSRYDLIKINAEDLIEKLKNKNPGLLLIDARSEKEFDESHLPFALNFPVLSNSERHNVGLIYKKYSQSAALLLALQYADPKLSSLKKFLERNNASGKEIFIYCWRGGGRSSYLAKMIIDAGYKPLIITGGHKAYRGMALDFFSKEFQYELIEITGPTGSGKTEILRAVKAGVPVIDLEEAAHHFSSLLGAIPYKIRDIKPVANQSAFENNIYAQIILHNDPEDPFLIESESKRVGNFNIPENLFRKMNDAPVIEIISSLESRINRIRKDYFENPGKGAEEMLLVMKAREKFFIQQLSKSKYSAAISFLLKGSIDEFIEMMIVNYYDLRYRKKNKAPLITITTDNLQLAKEKLLNFYSSYKKEKPVY
jgi:tRNA 2-selenouridine synthase